MTEEKSTTFNVEGKEIAEQMMNGIEPIKDTAISPSIGIASIALNMAMKFHDINTVQDGALYNAYKLDGKNFTPLHLDMVFHTAEQIETWLLGASDRIAKSIFDAINADETEEPMATDEDFENGTEDDEGYILSDEK